MRAVALAVQRAGGYALRLRLGGGCVCMCALWAWGTRVRDPYTVKYVFVSLLEIPFAHRLDSARRARRRAGVLECVARSLRTAARSLPRGTARSTEDGGHIVFVP